MEDVAEAYKNGLLTDVVSRTKNATPAIATGEKPFRFTGQIGEPAGRTKIGDDDIKGLWEIATQRSGGKNQTAISEARKRLLLQAHVQDIAGVVGKSQAELTKALRSWSNYPKYMPIAIQPLPQSRPQGYYLHRLLGRKNCYPVVLRTIGCCLI